MPERSKHKMLWNPDLAPLARQIRMDIDTVNATRTSPEAALRREQARRETVLTGDALILPAGSEDRERLLLRRTCAAVGV